MIPFFELESNRISLRNSISTWKGTIYWNYGRTKNGVDCAGLIAEILKEIGLLDNYVDRYYPKDWYLHTNEQILLNSLVESSKFLVHGTEMQEVFKEEFDGDLVLLDIKSRGIFSHIGFWLKGDIFFHCLEKRGAILDEFSRWKVDKKIFRIFKV